MTLIIGIKCKDGIVMAADGVATLGSMGQKTVLQPTKKLWVLQEKMVIGVSGAVGLGQLLQGKMESLWCDDKALRGKKPYEAMSVISQGFREYIIPELQVAQISIKTFGNAGLNSALTSTLLALPISQELCLFQFDPQGSPEQSTDELPFVSIGSGQTIADPFLCLLRKVFWSEHQPIINEALVAAIWTLVHAIEVNPGGVAEPIQVITMRQDGNNTVIKELSPAELSEHREMVKEAEKAIADSLTSFREAIEDSDTTTEIPEPPTTV